MLTKIAYLGPEGTFAHLVARKRFPSATLVPQPCIADVFRFAAVDPRHAGVVPIENSSGGTIYDTVDELVDSGCRLSIQEQLSLNVRLALLGRKDESINVIYSHFAPFHHCENWLNKYFPKVDRRVVASTGDAVRRASTEKGAAAIGGRQSARLYQLDVLHFPLAQDVVNVTQFFALSQANAAIQHSRKTSLVVALQDRPGSLCSFLDPFRMAKVNLSRIVSRPIAGQPNKYIFFVDVLGTAADPSVRAAIEAASQSATSVRTVGVYPVHRPFNS